MAAAQQVERAAGSAEHFSDPYVRRAQGRGAGARGPHSSSRSSMQRSELVVPGAVMTFDLGAAPGGWSQYAARQLAGKGRVVAHRPVAHGRASPGSSSCRAISTKPAVARRAAGPIGEHGRRSCVVGHGPQHDGHGRCGPSRARCIWWNSRSICAVGSLRPGGDLLMKVFQGAGFQPLVDAAARQLCNR